MADFDTTLNSILGNSDAMSQIMALAQSISSGMEQGNPSSESEENESDCDQDAITPVDYLSPPASAASRDAALLQAVRPFLRQERQKQVDRALELVGMLRLFRTALGSQRSE